MNVITMECSKNVVKKRTHVRSHTRTYTHTYTPTHAKWQRKDMENVTLKNNNNCCMLLGGRSVISAESFYLISLHFLLAEHKWRVIVGAGTAPRPPQRLVVYISNIFLYN